MHGIDVGRLEIYGPKVHFFTPEKCEVKTARLPRFWVLVKCQKEKFSAAFIASTLVARHHH
jgi:hypothetical protein